MIKSLLLFVALSSAPNATAPQSFASPQVAPDLLTAQSFSCSPRRTCKQIGSCREALWYLQNCTWGGKLDGDNDGVPCESVCR